MRLLPALTTATTKRSTLITVTSASTLCSIFYGTRETTIVPTESFAESRIVTVPYAIQPPSIIASSTPGTVIILHITV